MLHLMPSNLTRNFDSYIVLHPALDRQAHSIHTYNTSALLSKWTAGRHRGFSIKRKAILKD